MKNPIGLTPIERAQDIVNFPGQVDSGTLKDVIKELLVHIAMSTGHKVIADLEAENAQLKADIRRLLESIAQSSAEVCK